MASRRSERAVATRRLYAFENQTKHLPARCTRQRNLQDLDLFARYVWRREHRNRAAPKIAFGAGTPHGDQRVSFCDGYSYIELVKGQRSVNILLHELTHAMGYGRPHGKGFVRKYFDLLVEYGGCDRGALMLDAAMFKL